ncbi:unnamed protein product [Pneumocystis jirovecii]|uniref:Uncharacterized protein n=2 Tax=Pneumocystis jirovecii TaxID=42068 RepID=L0PDP6_PNEJI|nr:uncharacterized protein T551_02966 [Pneumocystis jirovecii RU7]KTW27467.1 hypothetical protein T551_02966 [Pneumocystis jirovecii RU7]CCJ30219.1 unnamed protein product [Pneumocystis jirovecii]
MGNINGKQTFYDKKPLARRLTKRKKNSGSHDIPALQNRYTGVPVHHFTDIFDPGTNLVSKSDEFCSLPKCTKTKNPVSSMYIDISDIQLPVYGKKDVLKPRTQHPSRRYRIDPINNRMFYQYFPSRPFHRQSISYTLPPATSARYGPSVSNISRYNTCTTSALVSSDETMPAPPSFSTHLPNKRLASPSNIDFGQISPGVLRVVNGLPSPCSSDDESSPQPFSQNKSRPVSIEKETLRHLVGSESENTMPQDILEQTTSCSSTTEQLLMEYYSNKDRGEEYFDIEDASETELQLNCFSDEKINYDSIFNSKNIKSNYPIHQIEKTIEHESSVQDTYESTTDYSFKHLQKQDISSNIQEHLPDIYPKVDSDEYTFDFLLKRPKSQVKSDFYDQHTPKNTKPYSAFNTLEIPPIPSIPSLFVSDQRITISG